MLVHCSFFFFFNDTATTEIYTLSLHDALPISTSARGISSGGFNGCATRQRSWRRQRAKISAGGKPPEGPVGNGSGAPPPPVEPNRFCLAIPPSWHASITQSAPPAPWGQPPPSQNPSNTRT